MKKALILIPLFLLAACDSSTEQQAGQKAAPQVEQGTAPQVEQDTAPRYEHSVDAEANYEHPSAQTITEMMAPSGDSTALQNEGTVLQNIDAKDYSYLEVQQGENKVWLAAIKTDVKPGSVIRYEEGMMMSNFYSKQLERTFPSVLFIGRMEVIQAAN